MSMAAAPRRFTTADAMALIGAAAVGLALSRAWSEAAAEVSKYWSGLDRSSWPSLTCWGIVRTVCPVVAAVTPTLLALRLRRPRPPRRRLFAPPGLAACVVATIVIALEALLHPLGAGLGASSRRRDVLLDELARLGLALEALNALSSMTVGIAVAAVWGSMALAHRWRPERGWIDRAGRAVGWFWIAVIPVRLYFNVLYPYLSE